MPEPSEHTVGLVGTGIQASLSPALHEAEAAAQGQPYRYGLLDIDRLGARAGERADGLIHATPTGMAAHPGRPLPEELLHRALWVAEVVYRPLETELPRSARERGCRALDGGGMAVFQAAGSFELFTGVAPDRERMLRHFARLGAG